MMTNSAVNLLFDGLEKASWVRLPNCEVAPKAFPQVQKEIRTG